MYEYIKRVQKFNYELFSGTLKMCKFTKIYHNHKIRSCLSCVLSIIRIYFLYLLINVIHYMACDTIKNLYDIDITECNNKTYQFRQNLLKYSDTRPAENYNTSDL